MAKAVIHVSEAQAAEDFSKLLAQVRAGVEVVIEDNARPIAVIRRAGATLDWSGCELVEVDPSRVGGRPVLKGTRMPIEDILANFEYGLSMEEISEQFGIEIETIHSLLTYAERHHAIARPVR